MPANATTARMMPFVSAPVDAMTLSALAAASTVACWAAFRLVWPALSSCFGLAACWAVLSAAFAVS